MRKLVVPTTSSLMEPEVKIKKRNKRISKNGASIRRLPSQFELVESAHDSFTTLTSGSFIPLSQQPNMQPKQAVFLYVEVF